MTLTNFTYFFPEKPVLITKEQSLFQQISDSGDYVAERKYNGIRLQLHYLDGKFQFWNRHQEDVSKTIKFQPNTELAAELAKLSLKGYCLFDGELRQNKVKGVSQKVMLFDVFIWDGELLTDKPFSYRRKILEGIVPVDGDPLGCPFQFTTDFGIAFEGVIPDEEIEGLVMKRKDGQLKIGRKSGVDSGWMYKVRKPCKKYKY